MPDMPVNYGQGFADVVEAGSADATSDAAGITNPNLHRRILSDTGDHTYKIGIFGLNSYRTESWSAHDDDSDESEIP
jgi:hypothetical protein